MKSIAPIVIACGLLLAACGNRSDLRPAADAEMPVAPAGASETPTAAELIEPEPQAIPRRSDEPLKRSEERPEDPFDLPPPE